MRKTALALSLATALGLMLSACGGSDETAEAPATEKPQQAAEKAPAKDSKATKTATANPNDPNNLPKLKCPAKVNKDLPGPDVIGIKLGMSQEQALNIVRCHTKDQAYVSFQPRWLEIQTYGIQLGPQAFQAQHGDTSECSFRSFSDMQKCGAGNRLGNHVAEKIVVATPGLPGRETVVGIWRSQSFKEGEMPARDSVVDALVKKYGPFQHQITGDPRREDLFWGQDSTGNVPSEQSPLAHYCISGGALPTGGAVWREGCGLNIAVRIIFNPQNPNLVKDIHLGMIHQENLWSYAEAIQVELEELEQKRRQEELNRARDAGSDIQL